MYSFHLVQENGPEAHTDELSDDQKVSSTTQLQPRTGLGN